MPQTAASIEQRIKVLNLLAKRFSDIAWEICIEQINPGSRIGHYNYRPNWRNDATGAGQVVTTREMYEFNRKALDLLIAWPTHDEKTLGDMVEALQGIPQEDQTKIWDLIDKWSQNAGEFAKAELRERVRQFAFTRRSRHRKLGETLRDHAREVYDQLRPENPVIRHGWLFAEQWVQESIEEIEEDFDYRKREGWIDRLRYEAITEIWDHTAFQGIEELISFSDASFVIGSYASSCITSFDARVDFINHCLSLVGDIQSKAEWCLQGFLSALETDSRAEALQAAVKEFPLDKSKRLFVCAPFQATTWRLLDSYNEELRTAYWKNVIPSWGRHTPAELTELIDCLLDARRPRVAFHVVHMEFKDVETSRLKRLLRDVVTINEEPASYFKLERYHISEALNALDGRTDVTRDEMAQLEFMFISALNDSEHGIPNLERQIADSPILFVQALALVYKRRDEGEDPVEWRVEKPDQRAVVASAAYNLLEQLTRIPGTGENGRIDVAALTAWLTEVRSLCNEFGRTEAGDQHIGRLLSKAPMGENGIWPCEAVCEAMEEIASPEIGRGLYMGVHNSRGVHWRGEGGEQERELAEKYHSLAERLYFDYPYVGGILENIAVSYEKESRLQDSEEKISRRLYD